MIILVLRIAASLRDEYEVRGLRGDGDYGKTMWLVYIIGSIVCFPVGLVGWILYWLKLVNYRKELERRGGGGGGGDYDDDDDDDRPRKKPSRRDEEDDEDE